MSSEEPTLEMKAIKNIVWNDQIDFLISIEALGPNYLPQLSPDERDLQHDFTLINDVVLFPRRIDYVDTLRPLPSAWISLMEKIIE